MPDHRVEVEVSDPNRKQKERHWTRRSKIVKVKGAKDEAHAKDIARKFALARRYRVHHATPVQKEAAVHDIVRRVVDKAVHRKQYKKASEYMKKTGANAHKAAMMHGVDSRALASMSEALSMQQRMKRKISFKKNAAKVKRGQKLARMRVATTAKLKSRARKAARKVLEKRMLAGKSKASLSYGARQQLEKRLDGKKKAIDRLAVKLLPTMKKREMARRQHKKS